MYNAACYTDHKSRFLATEEQLCCSTASETKAFLNSKSLSHANVFWIS